MCCEHPNHRDGPTARARQPPGDPRRAAGSSPPLAAVAVAVWTGGSNTKHHLRQGGGQQAVEAVTLCAVLCALCAVQVPLEAVVGTVTAFN